MCSNEINNSKFIKCENVESGGDIDLEYPVKTAFSDNIFSYCSSMRSLSTKVIYDTYGWMTDQPAFDFCIFKDFFHRAFDIMAVNHMFLKNEDHMSMK